MNEKNRIQKNLRIVKDHIQEINEKIEEIIGTPINKELWDLINSLIIKVHQHYKLSMDEIEMDLETKVKPILKKYKHDIGMK
ncbi:hypothetical protein HOM13_02000 [Candidatus Woesearchaeota archaeon]|jgi:hypothetical protein|nr:hypothetical protein [Candidatus Woesearchaeota archaeon]